MTAVIAVTCYSPFGKWNGRPARWPAGVVFVAGLVIIALRGPRDPVSG